MQASWPYGKYCLYVALQIHVFSFAVFVVEVFFLTALIQYEPGDSFSAEICLCKNKQLCPLCAPVQ